MGILNTSMTYFSVYLVNESYRIHQQHDTSVIQMFEKYLSIILTFYKFHYISVGEKLYIYSKLEKVCGVKIAKSGFQSNNNIEKSLS